MSTKKYTLKKLRKVDHDIRVLRLSQVHITPEFFKLLRKKTGFKDKDLLIDHIASVHGSFVTQTQLCTTAYIEDFWNFCDYTNSLIEKIVQDTENCVMDAFPHLFTHWAVIVSNMSAIRMEEILKNKQYASTLHRMKKQDPEIFDGVVHIYEYVLICDALDSDIYSPDVAKLATLSISPISILEKSIVN